MARLTRNNARDYIDTLSDEQIVKIAQGHDHWERDGSVGNEPLRIHAEALIEATGASSTSIIYFMKDLAFEAYRALANRYIAQIK